jgi:hypothetical protein
MSAIALPWRPQRHLASSELWTPGGHFHSYGEAVRKALGVPVGGLHVEGWNPRGIGILFNLADVAAAKILDHLNGKTSYTLVTPNYVALLTGTALQADTGVTITTTNNVEANYTSYARLSLAASDYNAAAAGAHPPNATMTMPVAQKTWPACTGSTSTVTNWCIVLGSAVTRGNAGDVTFFGTCTSTVISTTQTPPTVAAGGFTLTST